MHFSLPFSLIVLSRETILQSSFLADFLLARLTLYIPFHLRLYQSASSQTIIPWCTRAPSFLNKMQSSQVTTRKRNTSFSKRIEYAQQPSFYWKAFLRARNAGALQAEDLQATSQRRLFVSQYLMRNTRNSYSDRDLALYFHADLCTSSCLCALRINMMKSAYEFFLLTWY